MGPFIRAFFALKSVVVGLAVLGLWARSYFVGDTVRKGTDTQYVELGSAAGTTVITFGHDGQPTHFEGDWDYDRVEEPKQILQSAQLGDSPWNRLGFGFSEQWFYRPGRSLIVHIMIPHWAIFLLAIPSALLWVRRKWKAVPVMIRGPISTRECPRCGQMFVSIPQRCPVCGQSMELAAFR